MSVDASMMMNFIQGANVNASNQTAKTVEKSSNEASFHKLLAKMSATKDVTTNATTNATATSEVETMDTHSLMEMLSTLTNGMNIQEDEDGMSDLLQLLMQSVEETQKEQLDTEVKADGEEEAMSLMSMLMNMGTTSLPEEIVSSEQPMVQTSKPIDLSMTQADTRLNQLLVTLQAMGQPNEDVVATNSEVMDDTFVQVMNTVSVETPQTTERVVEEPIEIEVPVMNEMSQETGSANQEMNLEMGTKMDVEVVSSKENKPNELNDFEKAYQEMQAYRTPINPVKVEPSVVKEAEVKSSVEVNKMDVLNQISEQMKASNEVKDEFIIKLKPEGLGEIIVKLQSESDGKNILSLVVNNQNVKNVLESDLQGLKAALSQTNVEVKEVVYDNQSQYFQQSNFMEGNSFYQEHGQSNQANQSQSYQFNDDGQEETMQETVFMQSDSQIHQYV